MANCVICGKDSGRGRTCGSTCRSRLARSVAQTVAKEDESVASATVESKSVATAEQPLGETALPACVPMVIQERYNRYPCEPDYIDTINHLLTHTLTELQAMNTWIPVWRYTAGQHVLLNQHNQVNQELIGATPATPHPPVSQEDE